MHPSIYGFFEGKLRASVVSFSFLEEKKFISSFKEPSVYLFLLGFQKMQYQGISLIIFYIPKD